MLAANSWFKPDTHCSWNTLEELTEHSLASPFTRTLSKDCVHEDALDNALLLFTQISGLNTSNFAAPIPKTQFTKLATHLMHTLHIITGQLPTCNYVEHAIVGTLFCIL